MIVVDIFVLVRVILRNFGVLRDIIRPDIISIVIRARVDLQIIQISQIAVNLSTWRCCHFRQSFAPRDFDGANLSRVLEYFRYFLFRQLIDIAECQSDQWTQSCKRLQTKRVEIPQGD